MPDEKPFDPTPSRLARAMREGDVPRSRDVAAVASFVAAAGALCAAFGPLASGASDALRDAASRHVSPQPYLAVALCAIAVVASASVGGCAASLVESRGLRFTLPSANLKKLDPFAGMKRMFGSDAAVGALKAFVVACAVTCAVVPSAGGVLGAGSTLAGLAGVAALAAQSVGSAIVGAACVASAFAAVDAIVERVKWKRRLRMSFDELKRDHKATEGDPQLRGRRRQAHRNLIRGSIGRVKDAAFVVTNPTHVAVALEYRPPDVPVPCVLVRALDGGARAVKERARSLGVPIVEDVTLARRLLAATEVGDPIPRDTYGAVASIVAALLHEKKLAR
jgi:flagellar biosynthetic protein FlhB